ncbi:hypothetical protein [Chitinophaga lutea]|nr:hypothetical protein [Chitinophaga lutea]
MIWPAAARAQLSVTSPVSLNINTPTLFQNGTQLAITNHVVYTTPLLAALWTLRVRSQSTTLTGPGGATIPIAQTKVQVTSLTSNGTPQSGTYPEITLSTADQDLQASGLNLALVATLRYSIRYTLLGGVDLLKPAGTYAATLTYTLANLIGLGTVTNTTSLQVNITNQAAIVVNNPTATLSFTQASHYQLGRQLVHTNALQAFSNIPYSISVRAATDLMNGANSIAAGNVQVTPALAAPASGVSVSGVSLSTANQTIITSTVPTLQQLFNLTYSTTAGNTAFLNKPAGAYSTTLTYTITAP